MNYYPTIKLIAFPKGIEVSATQIEGLYKDYIIKKAVLTDINHYM